MIEVYLDVARSGRVMAHVLEPPGLGVRFESRAALEAELGRCIEEHLAWLSRHGESVPPPAPFRVVEEVWVSGNFESGDDVGFYTPDAVPITPEEIERYLRIGAWAHQDLKELIAPLPAEVLDWKRDARTRSIRDIALHVARAELWYMTRIVDAPEKEGLPPLISRADAWVDAHPEMVGECLDVVWEAFQDFARTLPPEWRSRVVIPGWYASIPERWTARKMLRRCIEHCREHTHNIRCILAAREERN